MSISWISLDLLWWRRSGGSAVIQSPRLNFARLATLGVLVAALGLAGCGRKGGLDAPPMAAAGDLQTNGQPGAAPAPAPGPDDKPVAAPTEKRKTPLDWLLN
jgi:predicted small lipoprotein YifL